VFGGRRISALVLLNVELGVWYSRRNLSWKGVDWQFTTRDAPSVIDSFVPLIYDPVEDIWSAAQLMLAPRTRFGVAVVDDVL